MFKDQNYDFLFNIMYKLHSPEISKFQKSIQMKSNQIFGFYINKLKFARITLWLEEFMFVSLVPKKSKIFFQLIEWQKSRRSRWSFVNVFAHFRIASRMFRKLWLIEKIIRQADYSLERRFIASNFED